MWNIVIISLDFHKLSFPQTFINYLNSSKEMGIGLFARFPSRNTLSKKDH